LRAALFGFLVQNDLRLRLSVPADPVDPGLGLSGLCGFMPQLLGYRFSHVIAPFVAIKIIAHPKPIPQDEVVRKLFTSGSIYLDNHNENRSGILPTKECPS
jgi:hypothetical protein